MLGIQSIVGTTWWLLICITYIGNVSTDSLTTIAGTTTIPIGWWWERIGQSGGAYVYLGICLMLNFILYGVISFVEMIAWIMYL